MQGLNTTPVHGHTAMFGVYRMLGIGLMLFALKGMAARNVWKATDTRFDRTFAIKALPPHLSDEPKLRERFEREALVDRLKRGALPLEPALRYGIEIAGALDESHRAGVVNRATQSYRLAMHTRSRHAVRGGRILGEQQFSGLAGPIAQAGSKEDPMFTAKKAGAWVLCLAVTVGVATVGHSQAFTRIAAKVVDQDGEPVKGALVTVTSAELPSFRHSKLTNKRGLSIVTFAVGAAIYDFTIEMEGYQTVTTEVHPRVGIIEERVFELSPVGAAVASDTATTVERPAAPTIASKKVRRYNEGVEAQQAGDLEGAMTLFREAAEIDPEFAPAFTGIATVAMEQGNYEKAAEAAERAVALDPESYRALQLRYDAYRKLGDEAKAAAAAKALRQAGDISEATALTFREAVEAYRVGDSEVAKARFRQALDLDPELVAAYSNLAQIYIREGDAARAAAMADEVLRRRPDDVVALKVRYEALHRMGDDDAAKSALDAVAAADPEWVATVLFDHAQELFNANHLEEARTVLEQILTVQPDHPESHYLAGLCCNSSGDFEGAKLHFTRFLELAPDSEMAPTAREILKYLQ